MRPAKDLKMMVANARTSGVALTSSIIDDPYEDTSLTDATNLTSSGKHLNGQASFGTQRLSMGSSGVSNQGDL